MTGLIGKKRGMTAMFVDGKYTAVTVLEVGPCYVVQAKTPSNDGYASLQLGYQSVKPERVTKPLLGHFQRAGIPPVRYLREFRDMDGDFSPGQAIRVEDIFQVGERVDVIGTSKGRGFAGVVKRHHFGRPNQSHGTHESFRGSGSIGAHTFPARTWPGQKMAGHMGNERVTVKHLKVLHIDAEKSLMFVKGAVPGSRDSLVVIRKSARQR